MLNIAFDEQPAASSVTRPRRLLAMGNLWKSEHEYISSTKCRYALSLNICVFHRDDIQLDHIRYFKLYERWLSPPTHLLASIRASPTSPAMAQLIWDRGVVLRQNLVCIAHRMMMMAVAIVHCIWCGIYMCPNHRSSIDDPPIGLRRCHDGIMRALKGES